MRRQACPKYPKQEVCIFLQYFQKSVRDEADFLIVDKCEHFLQVDSITWAVHSSHAQCNQGNKFAISLQYLKENDNDEVDILLVHKHQGFLQIDAIILDLSGQICPNYPE